MAFLSYVNNVDLDTVEMAASHQGDSAKPIGRLATPLTGQRWRSSALTPTDHTITIDINYNQRRKGRALFLQRPRLSLRKELEGKGVTFAASDTIRHILYQDEPGSTVVYDSHDMPSGMLPGYGSHGFLAPQEFEHGSWRIILKAASRTAAPEDWVEFGRAWNGPAVFFETSYASPLAFGAGSNSSAKRSASGYALHVRRAAVWRKVSVIFKAIRNHERAAILDYLMATNDWSQHLIGLEAGEAHLPGDAERHWLLAAHPPVDLTKVTRNFSQLPLALEEAL